MKTAKKLKEIDFREIDKYIKQRNKIVDELDEALKDTNK
jgi:hypothetical protein